MASHSLYRKWRSQTFSDLIGQEPVVRTLLNAVREGRLAHAYLFCGPRGTGKTSAARLLAKAVNCAAPHDGEPCNECLSCREITAGTSPDVIEIDAASNTGVDNIRDLRETVNLMTTGGHYRVLVIDEVHMLSTPAFNALLKTLEEPPPHVIFVLATTEAHKVLPTIVSRCQRFDFRRHTIRNIIARLQHVAEGEELELEPAAAELLARAAQGGMRDALSLLDQAMAFGGTHVDAETVRRMLGLADPGLLRTLITCVAENRAADGLHLINELVGNGADLRQLNSQLAEEWRALVLARAGADVAALMDRTDEDARELAELASHFSLETLTACARVFARNETPARGLPVPQLALELSFLECVAIQANGGPAAAVAAQPAERAPEVIRRAASATPASPAPTAVPAEPASPSRAPAPTPTPAPATSRSTGPLGEDEDIATTISKSSVGAGHVLSAASHRKDSTPASVPSVPSAANPPASPAPEADDSDGYGDYRDTLFAAQERWDLIKQVCKQKSRSVAALLHSARPVLVEPGPVPMIVIQADHSFHLDKLRALASREALEWALAQVLETRVRVRVVPNRDSGGEGSGASNGTRGGGGGGNGVRPRGGDPDVSNPGRPAGPSSPNGAAPAGPAARDGAHGGGLRDAGAGYIPANVTPIRATVPPAIATATATAKANGHAGRTLDEEVRADAVVQALMRTYGADLADVRPLDADDPDGRDGRDGDA